VEQLAVRDTTEPIVTQLNFSAGATFLQELRDRWIRAREARCLPVSRHLLDADLLVAACDANAILHDIHLDVVSTTVRGWLCSSERAAIFDDLTSTRPRGIGRHPIDGGSPSFKLCDES